jgi:hypothetical protein
MAALPRNMVEAQYFVESPIAASPCRRQSNAGQAHARQEATVPRRTMELS